MPKEKGPEWNYVTVLADGGDKGLAYALCTFTFSLQTFTIFFRINAFINVYYNFFDVYHIYGTVRDSRLRGRSVAGHTHCSAIRAAAWMPVSLHAGRPRDSCALTNYNTF